MIELLNDNLYRHGQIIGHIMGGQVFLHREISEVDERVIREMVLEKRGIHVDCYIRPGEFRISY